MYNFIKKIHRGRKRRSVYELSKGSCHINWLLTETRMNDPKIKKLKEKFNGKIKKCANFELETHFPALQNTVLSIFEV